MLKFNLGDRTMASLVKETECFRVVDFLVTRRMLQRGCCTIPRAITSHPEQSDSLYAGNAVSSLYSANRLIVHRTRFNVDIWLFPFVIVGK